MTRRKNTGRRLSLLPLSFSVCPLARCVSAASLAVLLQLPAYFSSCTHQRRLPDDTPIVIHWSTKSAVPETIDLFFFDTLGSQLLDSYQQISTDQLATYGLSRGGVKRLVALSGQAGETDSWSRIRTYGDLCKHSFSLERESASAPLLCGEMLLPEGTSRRAQLYLHPMLTAIRFRSVSCEFRGMPYANSPFLCTRLFLSYAGAECLPLGEGDGGPVSWLNPGFLDSAAVSRLPEPGLVCQDGLGPVSERRIYPDRTFYCYPGAKTHLVLEGSVNGIVCYYPIPLPDLAPDTCVQLDLTLRRIGSPDPDTPTVSGAIVLEAKVLPWEERDLDTVTY